MTSLQQFTLNVSRTSWMNNFRLIDIIIMKKKVCHISLLQEVTNSFWHCVLQAHLINSSIYKYIFQLSILSFPTLFLIYSTLILNVVIRKL